MIKINNTVECFCCGKTLDNWVYDCKRSDGGVTHVTVHPMQGLHFQTYGHYGSSIFDPMDGKATTLDIAICDACLVDRVKRVHGTGKEYVHEAALQKNEQYQEENDKLSQELLSIISQAIDNIDD